MNKSGFLCLLLGLAIAVADGPSLAAPDAEPKAVLVTGASSGIGRKITEQLATEGYFVFAGARKPDDIAALSAIENVQGIRLDVTIQSEIDAAVVAVSERGLGLYGIVNNAGVNVIGPLIEVEESELDFLFDVNVYGPYRVTRAFAPLLIESRGRIINISSISGILSGPFYGIYSMSKHALEAYTDSLARELEDFGIEVIAVEPGNFRTNIYHSRCDRLLEQGYDVENTLFRKGVTRMLETCRERPEDTDPEPDIVADAVLHALFAADPKEHYLVVPEQRQAEWTIRKVIEELVSLNEGHPFSYSRDELVRMLDEALAPGR